MDNYISLENDFITYTVCRYRSGCYLAASVSIVTSYIVYLYNLHKICPKNMSFQISTYASVTNNHIIELISTQEMYS